ncbi:hypothetical protein B296_00028575 [Ensete ventricosum]|uniref:Uncharacterized protein n=1 Tax=Ensete ventricosum TaxID=4639 RepID=A0A426XUF4_ENSVE|nr:hypothetical protein B296_00028575 [Ensete ventricosum]
MTVMPNDGTTAMAFAPYLGFYGGSDLTTFGLLRLQSKNHREIPNLGDGGAGEDEHPERLHQRHGVGRRRQTLGRRVVGGRLSKLKLAFDGVGRHVHDPSSFSQENGSVAR